MPKRKTKIPIGTKDVFTKKGKKKGVVIAYGSKKKPTFGRKIFKNRTKALQFLRKK